MLAVDDLDNVVKTIRSADDGRAARDSLQQQLSISEEQADAVLNMSLRRLTGLAVGELRNEENQLKQQVDDLSSLLADPVRSLSSTPCTACMHERYVHARKLCADVHMRRERETCVDQIELFCIRYTINLNLKMGPATRKLSAGTNKFCYGPRSTGDIGHVWP